MGKEKLKKLRDRQKRSVKNREKRGLGRIGFLDLSRIEGDSPDWYSIKGGKDRNVIDIYPFVVTQDWYKSLRTVSGEPTGLEPGDWEYKLEVPIHRDIGLNNEQVLCLKRAFGKRCPICDDLAEEYDKDKKDQDSSVIKALSPSWRDVYNVFDYEDENESEDIKLWEFSYHLFEKYYLEALEEQEDEELTPVDPEDGRIINFKGRKKQIGQNEFFEAEAIEFEEREEQPGDDIVEETISLDELLIIPTFEEVQRLYLELDEEEPVEEPEEPEEPEEKPKKPRGRKPKKTEKERPKAAEVVEELDGVCPARGEWGKDCNQLEECSECPEKTFEACAEEAERLEAAEKKPKKTRKPKKEREEKEEPKKPRRRRKK